MSTNFNADSARSLSSQAINALISPEDIIEIIKRDASLGLFRARIDLDKWKHPQRDSAARQILEFAGSRGFVAERKRGGDMRDSFDYIEITWDR